jgi:AcrR family transcriptional regulator
MTAEPAPVATAPRQRLLDAAIEHLGRTGIGDTSLRGLAEALGTSPRMLSYHFGSREGLLVGDPDRAAQLGHRGQPRGDQLLA